VARTDGEKVATPRPAGRAQPSEAIKLVFVESDVQAEDDVTGPGLNSIRLSGAAVGHGDNTFEDF